MTDEFNFSTGLPSEEMASYLQMYLDETDEQLESLVQTLLALEGNPGHRGHLNEAFRLIHSIKGSAGMMGLDSITVLTHHLENHFERLRSGLQALDLPMMELVLRCIDFLRECNGRLRGGQALSSAPELLEQLVQHVAAPPVSAKHAPAADLAPVELPASAPVPAAMTPVAAPVELPARSPSVVPEEPAAQAHWRLTIRFEAGLQLADLKAELVLSRLLDLGEIREVDPPREELALVADLRRMQVLLTSDRTGQELREAADVGGVQTIELDTSLMPLELDPQQMTGGSAGAQPARSGEPRAEPSPVATRPVASAPVASAPVTSAPVTSAQFTSVPAPPVVAVPIAVPVAAVAAAPPNPDVLPASQASSQAAGSLANSPAQSPPEPVAQSAVSSVTANPPSPPPAAAPPAASPDEPGDSRSKVAETVRVDIDRLDDLLNLAGELVVTNARFVQISRAMGPAFKKPVRTRAFGETIRRLFEEMKSWRSEDVHDGTEEWSRQLVELESEIDAVEAQARLWEEGRRCYGQITEAVNQLTRVSKNLQRGVLQTRMVPVGPLFNRFKRVVRDISHELGKQVHLEIHGEKTELDKRMIDELGDPLVHLVRNAIDHGLEPAEVRLGRGKPAVGTLTLEAVHSGNNVYIHVRDDGGGIDAAKIRRRIVDRGLVTAEAAAQLTDTEAAEFIWHPGFSTAEVISDISGRGVGMDIVKTRISELNGTISVDTELERGTTISIRLPLTLAIIRCLLFRLRHGMFAVPIDGVREIVSVPVDEVVTIHGRHTIEVRGEFIPLVDIDDVFEWPELAVVKRVPRTGRESLRVNVVILQATSETIGLRVDELQGGQDIVIKSLAENFVHIRGLSGASILGDGSVCLLLDVAAAIDLAVRQRRVQPTREPSVLAD